MDKTITALIPVKANSARLPGKNILPFGESNLLLHKIGQLKRVEGIADIVVSSDSEAMLEMARRAGVKALLRPEKYANESVPFGEFLDYLAATLPNAHLLWACVTSPLVGPELYERAIATYFEKLAEGYDSLITLEAHRSFYFFQGRPLNFETGLGHRNSEFLEPVYHFTNGINLAPMEMVARWHYNFGPNPWKMVVDKRAAVDIDDIWDYLSARAYWERGEGEER